MSIRRHSDPPEVLSLLENVSQPIPRTIIVHLKMFISNILMCTININQDRSDIFIFYQHNVSFDVMQCKINVFYFDWS
jgi:hypothetical protein